ncbi:MAG: hypothetical protein JSU07_03040 [Bacteroidetes bacterium]|nr:hypothetical protein [Bacteroidota bacterium]
MKHILINAFYLFLLSACIKDKPVTVSQPTKALSTQQKVYIVNEGNYGSGNSSVSLFDTGTGIVISDYFKSQNNLPIGDVAQSICYFNNLYYIVVNNSNKIIICNSSFKKIAQINGFTSPRYILPLSNQKALVSDLYANAISVVDLSSNIKVGAISCNGWSEKMAILYNSVYVTNMYKNYTYVINAQSNQITDSIYTGYYCGSLVIDKYNKLWVLGSGDSTKSTTSKLTRINTTTNQIEQVYNLPKNFARDLCINGTNDTLYFLNSGIWQMPVLNSSLPSSPIVQQNNKNFYAININPLNGNIYVSDAIDYVQNSNIYIYSSNGLLLNNFKAGINSNSFLFH